MITKYLAYKPKNKQEKDVLVSLMSIYNIGIFDNDTVWNPERNIFVNTQSNWFFFTANGTTQSTVAAYNTITEFAEAVRAYIATKLQTPVITVDGTEYRADFDSTDYVAFGCAKISKNQLKALHTIANGESGFEAKIGKGVFSGELIASIVTDGRF